MLRERVEYDMQMLSSIFVSATPGELEKKKADPHTSLHR